MSYQHIHESGYPPPPGSGPGYGFPPPPPPANYQGYFKDDRYLYPPPQHIQHQHYEEFDHQGGGGSGCFSFLKGCLAALCCCCVLEECCCLF